MGQSTWEPARREELRGKSEEELRELLEQTRARAGRLRERLGREELLATIARRRVLRTSGDALFGARLDVRLERLFDAVRRGAEPWPVNEVVRVIDGLVARLITRRISLGFVGLLTAIPAVASLVLLAKQNSEMVQKNQAEEIADFRQDRTEMTDLLFARYDQITGQGETAKNESLPAFHPRLRAEAFNTLIALEKERWSEAERKAMPPTRFVDLRGADLRELNLGGAIGLEVGSVKNDFTRLRLDGANLAATSLLFSHLDGTVFRGAEAEGMTIVSPSMDHADLSDVRAPGARFEYNAKTQDFLSMAKTNFDRADLREAVFTMAYLDEASFDGTRLEGVVFDESNFIRCDFSTASIGESADWSKSSFHQCHVTVAQAAVIKLPEYCFFEKGEAEGTQRIMTDPAKYEAWYAKHAAEMEA
ncbi:MAG: pentapeptide repeat-containing protein, partial [Verrucomicrobiae bacterium]|nr:pentapeptide repeat-containing protein [Verrucomicrobiae bacterium]